MDELNLATGFALGPLLLAGVAHCFRHPNGGPSHPLTRIRATLLGTVEVAIATAALLHPGRATMLAVSLLYASFALSLVRRYGSGAAAVPCGCSVVVSSYVDVVTIGRTAVLLAASLATLAVRPGGDANAAALVTGVIIGVGFFLAAELTSHLRWSLRTHSLPPAG